MAKRISKRDDLTPDAHNANQGTERGRYMLEASMRECGAGRSILADKEGRIIAGNKTLEVAEALDIPVRVVETDGKELVVVQRNDLDLDSDQARKLAYYDNRSSEVGLAWDASQIAADLEAGLDLGAMFKEEELGKILERAADGILRGVTDFSFSPGDGQSIMPGNQPKAERPPMGREDKTYHFVADLQYNDSLLVERAVKEAKREAAEWLVSAASAYLKGEWQ